MGLFLSKSYFATAAVAYLTLSPGIDAIHRHPSQTNLIMALTDLEDDINRILKEHPQQFEEEPAGDSDDDSDDLQQPTPVVHMHSNPLQKGTWVKGTWVEGKEASQAAIGYRNINHPEILKMKKRIQIDRAARRAALADDKYDEDVVNDKGGGDNEDFDDDGFHADGFHDVMPEIEDDQSTAEEGTYTWSEGTFGSFCVRTLQTTNVPHSNGGTVDDCKHACETQITCDGITYSKWPAGFKAFCEFFTGPCTKTRTSFPQRHIAKPTIYHLRRD